MRDIKKIKAEIHEAASGRPPSEGFVAQDDIMDMMLMQYFNPLAQDLREITVEAIAAAASMLGEDPTSMEDAVASIEKSKQQVKAILAKYS